MNEKRHVRCKNCGTINLNREYCKNCGEPINYAEQRRLEAEQLERERRAKHAQQKPSEILTFFKKAKAHNNILVRGLAKLVSSIWFIALAIVGIIAFVFAYLAL